MLFIDAYIDFAEYIPIIVSSIFYIMANILIILSGKKQLIDVIGSKLLKLIGLLNILFITIILFFPPIQTYTYSIENEFFKNSYSVFRILLSTIPFLLTYGVLMLKFGKINQERYGSTLKIAGILGIIGYALPIPFLFYFFSSHFAFLAYFSSLGGFFVLAEYIIFIIYGKKNSDIHIGVAGIMLLIGFIVSGIIGAILVSSELLS